MAFVYDLTFGEGFLKGDLKKKTKSTFRGITFKIIIFVWFKFFKSKFKRMILIVRFLFKRFFSRIKGNFKNIFSKISSRVPKGHLKKMHLHT